jgi:hypothetical protein
MTFHRVLFEELLQAGISHQTIIKMSLRTALRAKYGSDKEIDQALGIGVSRGVSQAHGRWTQWRKAWCAARKEQNAPFLARAAALEALGDAVEECRASAVLDSEIQIQVQKLLNING